MDIMSYIKNLNTKDEIFSDVFQYGIENNVPIIDSDALTVVKHLLKISGARNYLEIGTAIGYSGLHLLSVFPDSKLITIEIDEEKHQTALSNFENHRVSERVTAINGDAKTFEPDALYESLDFLFIDASKGNNQLFFDKYSQYIKKGGLIIVDNILLRGQIVEEELSSRNRRKLREKVNDFNQKLAESDHETSYLPVGDGLLVITKG